MIETDVLRAKPIDFNEEFRPEFSPDLSSQMKAYFQTVDLTKTFVEQFLSFFISANYAVYEFLPVKNNESEDGLKAYQFSGTAGTFFCVITDPRLKAGTFSNRSLDYFHRFLDYVEHQPGNSPFVLALNSAGVRLTQTRDMFNRIWGVVPRLFQLRKQRLFLSVADQQCLGASALFFAQAHYRIVAGKKTILNLTGPGVINYFFGEDRGFFQYSSAQYQFERHLLVQEYTNDFPQLLRRLQQILNYYQGSDVSDVNFEIFPGYSESGLSYLCRKDGFNFGLLINPLGHPVNAISVSTIEKYIEALILYKALRIPILVVTDSPGGDPREKSSNRNVIMKSLQLIECLVDYPFAKIGLVAGRCFGGSGLFALPHVHFSDGLYALVGSKFGAISDEFIERIAKNSPEWQTTKNIHKPDLSDLTSTNNIKRIISWEEIPGLVKELKTLSISKATTH